MFRWPVPPSSQAPEHEIADFTELLCWQQGSTSSTQLAQSIGRLAENQYSDGVPEEEEIPKEIEGAFVEIERRIAACNGGYPFLLWTTKGTSFTQMIALTMASTLSTNTCSWRRA